MTSVLPSEFFLFIKARGSKADPYSGLILMTSEQITYELEYLPMPSEPEIVYQISMKNPNLDSDVYIYKVLDGEPFDVPINIIIIATHESSGYPTDERFMKARMGDKFINIFKNGTSIPVLEMMDFKASKFTYKLKRNVIIVDE